MYAGKHLRLKVVLRFSWQSIAVFAIYASMVVFALSEIFPRFNGLPFSIVSVTGIAVAFYVGFKNNSSYERLWEARKIWGAYVNSSRIFANYVLDFIAPAGTISEKELKSFKRRIIKRHIAYLSSVSIQLRKNTVWRMLEVGNKIVTADTNFTNVDLDKALSEHMNDEEVDYVITQSNPAVHILKMQNQDLQKLYAEGCMSNIHHIEIAKTISDFLNQQGACERIKGYPFPRQYAYYSKLFVYLLIGILPFSIYSELSLLNEHIAWMTIPISVTISWIYYTMEVVGDSSENPFENAINDIPLTAICRTIEIDLLQLLGGETIPEKIRAENDILM